MNISSLFSNYKSRIIRAVNIALTVLIAALAAFTVYALVCASKGKAVNVFGKSMFRVVTGSMEPSIRVGDYILVSKTEPSELREGDIITYYSEEEDVRGLVVTHRIVSVNSDGSFVTKGDANPVPDKKAVREDQLIGRYVGKSRFFHWLNSFADGRKLLLIFVIIPIALIALYEVRTIAQISFQSIKEKSPGDDRERLIREAIDREKERLAAEHFGEAPPEKEEQSGAEKEEQPPTEDTPPEENDTGEDLTAEEVPHDAPEAETDAEKEVETVESGSDNEKEND